nr:hypothetical protein [Ruminococcus sp.]
MREAGADIKATADIMGHTEVELTLNTYTDATDEFKKKEIALIDLRGKNRLYEAKKVTTKNTTI